EIEDAADGNAASEGRMVRYDGREMSAGRPAADKEPIAVEAKIVGALAENGKRAANFSDDVGEARLRRQRIAEKGDVDSMGARSLGDKGEHVFVVALPIAAVNEDEQWRLERAAGEVIEPRAWAISTGNIQARARARPHGRAQFLPACQPIRAVRDSGGVVVGGVEGGAVHAAVDRRCSCRPRGYVTH